MWLHYLYIYIYIYIYIYMCILALIYFTVLILQQTYLILVADKV